MENELRGMQLVVYPVRTAHYRAAAHERLTGRARDLGHR
jgi:hypothetical protein